MMMTSLKLDLRALLVVLAAGAVVLTALNHGIHSKGASIQLKPIKKSFQELSGLTYQDVNLQYDHAPSLFNALHSSMRQFGSSIYHNGMTLFPTFVQEGTIFYHGRSDADYPAKMEWLAFEMEQANSFASPRRRRRGPGGPRGRSDSDTDQGKQHIFDNINSDEELDNAGFVQTFRATRDWKLLYLDGTSAGKSALGTMDLTDILLDWPITEHGRDYERAQALCDWQEAHKLNLDGFVRMETCFEVIFCDFTSPAISLVRTVEKSATEAALYTPLRTLEWLRAAEGEYMGFPSKVHIDYTAVTSIYAIDSIASSLNYTSGLPRLSDIDEEDKRLLHREVISAVQSSRLRRGDFHDWQKTTDFVIQRYAKRLRALKVAAEQDKAEAFETQVSFILLNFLDFRLEPEQRRVTGLDACIYEFLPTWLSSPRENALFSAVESVMTSVCVSLMHMHDNTSLSMLEKAEMLGNLEAYLRWTTWLECVGCQPDEICFVTMWPFGSLEDRTPNCKNVTELTKRPDFGYWGQPGSPK